MFSGGNTSVSIWKYIRIVILMGSCDFCKEERGGEKIGEKYLMISKK